MIRPGSCPKVIKYRDTPQPPAKQNIVPCKPLAITAKPTNMKRILLLLGFLLSLAATAQDYEADWNNVLDLEAEVLTRQAAEETEKIYLKAKKDKNEPQLIKTFLFRAKYMLALEEDAQVKIITTLQAEKETMSVPGKAIMENLYAQMLSGILNRNSYHTRNRTPIANAQPTNDITLWGVEEYQNAVALAYRNSVAQRDILYKTPLDKYDAIVEMDVRMRDTKRSLYDFLAESYINFLAGRSYIRITDSCGAALLMDTPQFLACTYNDDDPDIEQLLKFYQSLEQFYSEKEDPLPLHRAILRRLQFARYHTDFKQHSEVYKKTLEHYSETWKGSPFAYNVQLELALFYVETADKEKAPDNLSKALTLCDSILKDARNAICAEEAQQLRNSLVSQKIGILAERYVTPKVPVLAKVDFKNMSSIRIKIYKVPLSRHDLYSPDFYEYVEGREVVDDRVYPLPTRDNLFEYSTEILLPPLEKGFYIIEARPGGESTGHDHALLAIQATGMALTEQEHGNLSTYQLTDRLTGKPIKKAKGYTPDASGTTDARGRLSFESVKKERNGHVEAFFVYEGDTLKHRYYDYYRNSYDNSNKDKEYEVTVKLFTDRSIYRPGQKMFFKGIVTKQQGSIRSVVKDIYVYVLLEDPSGNEAGSMRVKVNDFGSFTGEFQLPKTGLTGEYVLTAEEDEDYEEEEHPFWDDKYLDFQPGELMVSVEEYKRPKFEIKFDDVKEDVRLNEKITVKGKARSFSDAPIGGARIVYKVERSVKYRYGYDNDFETAVVAQGEALTADDGTFSIDFPAEPDPEARPKTKPVFVYTVTTDITDISGETRSAQQQVSAGYHSLELSVSSPAIVEDSGNKITIDSENLNGQFLPVKGKITVHKIRKETYLKDRPWPSPDIQTISKGQFEELFPYMPYETIKRDSIIREKQVFAMDTDTGTNKEIILNGANDWEPGSYVVNYTAVDSAGYAAEASTSFMLRKSGKKMLMQEGTFDYKAVNKDFRKDGYAEFLLRSPLPQLYVNVESYSSGDNTFGTTVTVKDGMAKIKVPVDRKYNGTVKITFDFVWQGQYFTKTFDIPAAAESRLQIEAAFITAKFLPGSPQTWSFLIKGSNNLPAEVLAAMYDMSLDEFTTQSWENFYTHNGYSYVPRKTLLHYGTDQRSFNNEIHRYRKPANDYIKMYGFDINDSGHSVSDEARERKSEKDILKNGGILMFGTISDTKGPLPGVLIAVQDTGSDTVTDHEGRYSIAALKGETLEISMAGYRPALVQVGYLGKLDITLNPGEIQAPQTDRYMSYSSLLGESAYDQYIQLGESGDLDMGIESELKEVRVDVYRKVASDKSSISFSVISIDSIEDRANASVLQSLQGQVAGLNIVTGSGAPGADSTIILRGVGSINGNVEPLFVVDGIPLDEDAFRSISQNDILDVKVFKDSAASSIYGNRGANGVIVITTRKGFAEEQEALKSVKARKNLSETAFFYPQLLTDKKGNLSFTFTSPEALTQWKLRLFAHDKKAVSGYYESFATTQKDLMVVPNMPRFLREKDNVVITAKITNLTAEAKVGNAMLQLFDAATMEPIDAAMNNTTPMQPFTIPAKGSTTASWTIAVPSGVQGVQYKVVAKTGNFTDGEENILPVLTNSMLVTESIPLWVKPNTTKEYTLENLKNNTSTTLRHQGITLEYTSNPTWLALQSLPYLMEYEHECAEQVFSRYYADALATHVMNSNPKISEIFADWKKEGKPLSKLAQNEELKSVIMAESPWLLDTESDEEQKCRLAVLFDLDRMKGTMAASLSKLEDKQSASGGFPWFEGGQDSDYITRHILAGLGHLEKLGATPQYPNNPASMIRNGLKYIDTGFLQHYRARQAAAKKDKKARIINPYSDLHYLYTRSFYLKGYIPDDSLKKAINIHLDAVKDKWIDYSLYEKGMAALTLHRFGDTITAKKVVASLKETSANNEEWGMYWIANKPGWWWYHAPIETQALLIEAFAEVDKDTVSVDAMKVWLIKQKQNKNWPTTKSTAEAVYALMLQGTDWLSVQDATKIQYGDAAAFAKKVADTGKEAGTGYMKLQWKAEEVDKSLATLHIENKGKVPGYGGLYWQYFEELDKIPSAQAGLMNVEKELYLKTTAASGTQLEKITAANPLKIGSLVTVRLVITIKEDVEYIHLKDMRASAFEPVDVLSGYHHQDGLGFYRSTRDAATHFFFDSIRKGTYILEYDVRVNNAGEFSNGITTIQSMYAPEFSGHTKGIRVKTEQ